MVGEDWRLLYSIFKDNVRCFLVMGWIRINGLFFIFVVGLVENGFVDWFIFMCFG